MNKILINGDRACLPIDGMNRVLLEITRSLDGIVEKGDYILVIPSNVNKDFYDRIKDLKNIKIKQTILPYFRFWTLLFIDIAGVLLHRKVINFANRNGVFGGGFNILHDIIPIKFYENQNKKYLKRIQRLVNTSDCLFFPSHFTQKDIEKTMHCNCQMQVIHWGWQHYPQIKEDPAIFTELPQIKKGEYFFAMSTISPHKNFKFIYEVAKRNPECMFVITGAMNRGYGFEYGDLDNLIFTGRISDEKAKALLMNCKAFIFSSLYEGAGLPPLEALSCKIPVLASDLEVIHEYCGDSVYYFNPHDYDINLKEAFETKTAEPEKALGELSWDKAADDLINIIRYNLRS